MRTFSSMPRLHGTTAVCLFTGLFLAGTAAAQECPKQVPESSADRRTIARDFFGKADAAEKVGNDVDAIKAYQCSLKMVPHPNTAFNLGELAAKTGDLELALDAYATYLKLKPEAPDKAEVEGKMTALTSRVAAAREAAAGAADKPAQPADNPNPPPPTDAAVPERRVPEEPTHSGADSPDDEGGSSSLRTAGWVIAVTGGVLAVGGLVLNLGARGDMDDCRKLAKAGEIDKARGKCDGAKPKAYASYAMLGAGPVAIAAGLYLALSLGKGTGESNVAFVPLDDGAAVTARWRF